MKLCVFYLLLLLAVISGAVSAAPPPPVINTTTSGLNITIEWSSVAGASGYELYYAPYPYTGPESIASFDVGSQTNFDITLWEGAAYYVAVTAYDGQGSSNYSNIDLFNIRVAPELAKNRNVEYLESYLSEMLAGNTGYEYAIYAARLITNPNIHLYLKADQYFVNDISILTGSELLFLTPVDENCTTYEYQIQNDGDPTNDASFNYDLVDLNAYEVVEESAVYPAGYPFLPWFDRRVQSINATLKAAEVTSLEKAILAYFKYKHENYGGVGAEAKDLCVIATEEGTAFLSDVTLSDGSVFYDTSLNIVSTGVVLTKKPVLIFNQEETWFPLLDQRTVDNSGSIAPLLSLLALDGTEVPELLWLEQPLVEKLKHMHSVDEMPTEAFNLALEAAETVFQNINGDGEPLQSIPDRYPVYDFNFRRHKYLLINEIPLYASFLSPVADYMADFYQSHNDYEFSAEFHKNNTHNGCGELWGQNYNFYTIDQGWRFDTGVCLNLSNYAAAIMELAEEEWYKIGIVGHLFVFNTTSGQFINNGYLREANGSAINDGYMNLDGWRSVQDASGSAVFSLGYDENRQLDMARYYEQRTVSSEQAYTMFDYLYDWSEQKPSLGVVPYTCVRSNCDGGTVDWFEGWNYIEEKGENGNISYFEYPQLSN
jgi:hypothetical protein